MTNVNDMMKNLSIEQSAFKSTGISAFKSTGTSARTRPIVKQKNKNSDDHIVHTIIGILNNKKGSKYRIKKIRFKRDGSNLFKIICKKNSKYYKNSSK